MVTSTEQHPPDQPAVNARMRDWRPSRRHVLLLHVLGTLFVILGLVGYGLLAAHRFGAQASFRVDGMGLLLGLPVTVVVLAGLMAVHEGVHGLVILAFKIRPRFGVGIAYRVLPYAYTTAPGVRFTRQQYLVVAAAPTVVVGLLAAVLVWWTPVGVGWCVFAAALHLGGCLGDWLLMGIVCLHPRGSRFEDLRNGLRIHLPA